MGFHGRAAANKPKITMGNSKDRLESCTTCSHWTLEQWTRVLWRYESCFTIWQSDGLIWLGGWQENATCPNAQCKL